MTNNLIGSTTPRLESPSNDDNPSIGDSVIEWIRTTLGAEPFPWQEYVIRRMFETKPDGSLRFKTVFVNVSRQNGKTELVKWLTMYWLAHDIEYVLGTSHDIAIARESWDWVADETEELPSIYGAVKVRRVNGDLKITTGAKCVYRIVATGRKAGRGTSAKRLVMDELREMLDWLSISSLQSTTLAKPDAQVLMLSNAGDLRSVVWGYYRALGIEGTDPDMLFLEWSAPEDSEIDDRAAWQQANPSLGYSLTEEALEGKMRSTPAAIFKVENLCIPVKSLDEAVNPGAWEACFDDGTLENYRDSIHLCLEVASDNRHATLVAASQVGSGRVRVETVKTWSNVAALESELGELVRKIRPQSFSYYASSPTAALSPMLDKLKATAIPVGDAVKSCMSLSAAVAAGRLAHNGDSLLAGQLLSAHKQRHGDGWRFERSGQIDAAYAVAGAYYKAITTKPRIKRRLITTGGQ